MTYPNIIFSEEEKERLLKIAEVLEKQLDEGGKLSKDIERLSNYQPLVMAIQLAKMKELHSPFNVPNMNYWIFETDLGNQREKFSRLSGILSKFLLAIEGFPYEEMKDDDQQKGT